MKKISRFTLFASCAIFCFCAVVVATIAVYARYETSETARRVAAAAHLPALVSTSPSFFVYSTAQLRDDVASVRRFYENQDFSSIGMRVDFSTDDGKKRLLVRERGILNKVIEDRVIKSLVDESGERVTDAEVDQNVQRRLHEFGIDENKIRESLDRLYGWEVEDFKEKVVKTELYKDKARKIFEDRDEKSKDEAAHAKILSAKSRLDSGKSFSDTAKEFSEGATASQDGDLGWIELSGAEPNLAEAISRMKVNDRSDIIETSVGYHIIELRGMREDAGVKLYRIYQVIARKETFADWVNAYIKKASLWVLLPDYRWNEETGYVEFKNPVMNEFESKWNEKMTPSSSEDSST